MSYHLHCSKNYVWNSNNIVGKGAYGTIYKGLNRTNGELVAIKAFNGTSSEPQEEQMREFEVLKRVNHENVIKLIAVEYEEGFAKTRPIIVMELCTGGSLFHILQDPENTCGFEESEFLLVLGHLTAGMKHLRDNNLIHRDLKPGNIMKFIRNDGKTVYKLADFGAARELRDDESFKSLYGTAEYLHPHLYASAYLRTPTHKSFGATVDLWSIGVILYCTATGNLPFRPYDGRKNPRVMHYITTQKSPGVISGIQTQKDGEIVWSKELPDNCRLSVGLKEILTPILAGLLEADSGKTWSFGRYFKQVNELLSCEAIDVFDTTKLSLIKIYVRPEDGFNGLLTLIYQQTDILNENQILLWENKLFDGNMSYPRTKETKPLLLFSNYSNSNNINKLNDEDLPNFDGFSISFSLENDAIQARSACNISYLYKHKIEEFSLNCQLIFYTVDNFTKYINGNLKKLNEECDNLLEKIRRFNKSLKALKLLQQIANRLDLNITTKNLDSNQLSNNFQNNVNETIKQLHENYVIRNQLKSEWELCSKDLNCQNCAKEKAKTFVEQQCKSWKQLLSNYAKVKFTCVDREFHLLERIKMIHTNDNIKLLLSDIKKEFTKIRDRFGDWCNFAQAINLKLIILSEELVKYKHLLQQLEFNFTTKYDEYSEKVQQLLTDKPRNKLPSNNNNTSSSAKKMKTCIKLKTYIKTKNSDIYEEIQENLKLVNELTDLLEHLDVVNRKN